MAQRPLDYFQGLTGADRKAAETLVDRAGGLDAMALQPPRVARVNNRLVAASPAA